ncbi:MAG: hypothetical protein C0509_07960 [Acinetobacter sp.]|nr:hypothetical protein [Acinetobacter sp.]
MKIKLTLLAAAVALAPMSAMAGGVIDGFYNYNAFNVKQGGASEKARGHGYGVRGAAELNERLQLTGLYQENFNKVRKSSDKFDITETRVGLMGNHTYEGIKLLGGIEHIQLSTNDRGDGRSSSRGYVVKAGAQLDIIDGIATHLTVGYVDLSERVRGYEVETGARVKLVDNISGFVDYRFTRLNDKAEDPNVRLNQHLVRVGVGYHF